MAQHNNQRSLFLAEKENNGRTKQHTRNSSLIGAMDNFFQAIKRMDDTVMMPSRLLDVPLCDSTNQTAGFSDPYGKNEVIPFGQSSSDLFSFYTMLKDVRTDLIAGAPPPNNKMVKEDGNDSGPESLSEYDEICSNDDQDSRDVASAFRHHLAGLYSTLVHMTEAAQYITRRYQDQLNVEASGISSL